MEHAQLLEGLFRWIHVIAGVLWIGLLYYFNWINGVFASKLDAETKQKALPELLPRALYFFRWGAAYTWISGILLLGMVFYMGKIMISPAGVDPAELAGLQSNAMIMGIVIVFAGAVVYDLLWKMVFADKQSVGVAVSFAIVVGLMYAMTDVLKFTDRAMFIHVGGMFGTAMAMNVWMRIWPAQRKIITAIKAGDKPDAAWGAMAGLRSKHNTYMSVPLIFMMLNAHTSLGLPADIPSWVNLAVVTVVGWLFTNWVYKKSKTDAPASY
jgi:uncharacterized membrane protein